MTELNYRKRANTDAVVRLTDHAIIWPDLETEWTEYQTWLSEGNIPEEPEIEQFVSFIKVISDRQFYQQAYIKGFISHDDALQAVRTGYIPQALQSIIDTIQDPTEKFNAEMLLSGAVEFKRDHPLTSVIGSAFNMTETDIDMFFEDASKL